ncbi:MAG: orange carotenoid protein N-terminal domain-containing protein [Leptolyngbyaceae cyanobacterium bins.349]|nr:orange carotenoid protein N-terminal domain-containing protein [Leptolyngbyaceae cyanobacterium bins.349]
MTFTTDSTSNRFANPYLSTVETGNVVAAVTAGIKQLSTDDQLALLWYIYTEMGTTVTPAAPGAARLQLAEGLLAQVKSMSFNDQLTFMRHLVNKVGTPETRAYGILSANTKLAFWYQLAEWMRQGVVVPMPYDYRATAETYQAFEVLKQLDAGQQITVLRNIVIDMGVDPLLA